MYAMICQSIPNGTLNGTRQRALAGPPPKLRPNGHAMTPAVFLGLSRFGPLSLFFRVLQGDIFSSPSSGQRHDGNAGGGKGEERQEFQRRRGEGLVPEFLGCVAGSCVWQWPTQHGVLGAHHNKLQREQTKIVSYPSSKVSRIEVESHQTRCCKVQRCIQASLRL
jgi:hypothetical protein